MTRLGPGTDSPPRLPTYNEPNNGSRDSNQPETANPASRMNRRPRMTWVRPPCPPDGRSFNVVREGEDIGRQIALVKIEAKGLPVPGFLPPEKIKVGQWAFVFGRTFSASDPSVHMGVVSATRRIFGPAIQLDADTGPANCRGPIVDIKGRIMGIAVGMDASGHEADIGLYDSGIGFAAAIADIQELVG